MDMRLELVPLRSTDVDRSKAFYVDRVGFGLDHDVQPGNGMRIVQLTPPGSACSVVVGVGIGDPDAAPVQGLHLVVDDLDAVRGTLVGNGVEVSDGQRHGRRRALRLLQRPRRQLLGAPADLPLTGETSRRSSAQPGSGGCSGEVCVGGAWESFLMQATRSSQDSVAATLDEVSRLHAVRTDADAGLFELAAVFADQHSGDSLPRSRTPLPGLERAVRVGGVGTPRVAELAWAELGARLQISPWSAKRLVADALDVRHRLPLVWAQVVARRARVSNARRVAVATRHLSVEAAARVDAAMVDHVDGSLSWGRFEARLAGKIVAADPALAAAREDARLSPSSSRNGPGPPSRAPPGSTCGPRSG